MTTRIRIHHIIFHRVLTQSENPTQNTTNCKMHRMQSHNIRIYYHLVVFKFDWIMSVWVTSVSVQYCTGP